jgi:hypothetical protein
LKTTLIFKVFAISSRREHRSLEAGTCGLGYKSTAIDDRVSHIAPGYTRYRISKKDRRED